ncbi:MAG: membrane protein of unknown function [Promethearchaeota archaeon]|nr:MAG: membrane protein of unknown function [Candidatus Lokiarchaeota archaeon]
MKFGHMEINRDQDIIKKYKARFRISTSTSKVIEAFLLMSFEIFIIVIFSLYLQETYINSNYSKNTYEYIWAAIETFLIIIFIIQLPIYFSKEIYNLRKQIIGEKYVLCQGKKYYFDGMTLKLRPKSPIKSILEIQRLENFGSSLTSLDLSKNEINAIQFPGKFPHLKELNLNYNKISQITKLDHVPKLERLQIKSNRLQALDNLSNNKVLTVINAQKNFIKKINLKTNPELIVLKLSDNELESLKDFKSLYKLINLNVSKNNLREIAYLEKLINLVFFNCRKNPIKRNATMPKFSLGKLWVRYCQLNGDAKILDKLVLLFEYANNQKRHNKLINYASRYYNSISLQTKRIKKKKRISYYYHFSFFFREFFSIIKENLKKISLYTICVLILYFILTSWLLEIFFPSRIGNTPSNIYSENMIRSIILLIVIFIFYWVELDNTNIDVNFN